MFARGDRRSRRESRHDATDAQLAAGQGQYQAVLADLADLSDHGARRRDDLRPGSQVDLGEQGEGVRFPPCERLGPGQPELAVGRDGDAATGECGADQLPLRVRLLPEAVCECRAGHGEVEHFVVATRQRRDHRHSRFHCGFGGHVPVKRVPAQHLPDGRLRLVPADRAGRGEHAPLRVHPVPGVVVVLVDLHLLLAAGHQHRPAQHYQRPEGNDLVVG